MGSLRAGALAVGGGSRRVRGSYLYLSRPQTPSPSHLIVPDRHTHSKFYVHVVFHIPYFVFVVTLVTHQKTLQHLSSKHYDHSTINTYKLSFIMLQIQW